MNMLVDNSVPFNPFTGNENHEGYGVWGASAQYSH
jgi:hypothetical protein